MTILRIATRKSPLALWQANYIGDQIKSIWPHVNITLVPMVTSGDTFLKDKLQTLGGKGLFVKELEEAILKNEADIAVHSMKDVPAFFPPGLILAAICDRHNPLDALISPSHLTLDQLPRGSVIGTTSLRRQSQLLALRPDLQIKSLRGNINTRLEKLRNGDFDAIILAAAGLQRMGFQENISEILDEEIMLPACGQGALGIECRQDDAKVLELIAPLNDRLTSQCVLSERHVNALLGGNCHVPLAVYCKAQADHQIVLRAKVLTCDGQTLIYNRQEGEISQSIQLAETCAQFLLSNGARDLLTLKS